VNTPNWSALATMLHAGPAITEATMTLEFVCHLHGERARRVSRLAYEPRVSGTPIYRSFVMIQGKQGGVRYLSQVRPGDERVADSALRGRVDLKCRRCGTDNSRRGEQLRSAVEELRKHVGDGNTWSCRCRSFLKSCPCYYAKQRPTSSRLLLVR